MIYVYYFLYTRRFSAQIAHNSLYTLSPSYTSLYVAVLGIPRVSSSPRCAASPPVHGGGLFPYGLGYHPFLYRGGRAQRAFLVFPAQRDVERLAQLRVLEGECLAGGFITLINEWLKNGMDMPAPELAKLLAKMTKDVTA